MAQRARAGQDRLRKEIGKAGLLADLGRYGEAEAMLKRVLAAAPDDVSARHQLANVYLQSKRHAELLEITGQLVAARPDDAVFHRLRALALKNLGDQEAAEIALDQALRLRPAEGRWHVDRALLYAHWPGRAEEGVAAAQEAIRLEPDSPLGYIALRMALVTLGRIAEAEQATLTAVSLDPTDPLIRFTLAAIHIHLGKFAEAREDMLAVLRAAPRHSYMSSFARQIEARGATQELADVYQMIKAALSQQAGP
jgi:tetratricopeptide (TPR) repeat protein